jgi:hypothetical protein
MNRSSHRTLCLIAAAGVTLLASQAALATPTPDDIRVACPGVDTALQIALTKPLLHNQIVGTVRVDMQLEGQRIVDVSTPDGPVAYRQAVQRAVRKLQCDGGSSERRTISFNVTFADPLGTETRG